MPGRDEQDPIPKVRWAARIRPDLLKRLYESDAAGYQDEDLCDEVGTRLYARCETFCMTADRQVRCPTCATVFCVTREGRSCCPAAGCPWSIDWSSYRRSITNYYASPGRAIEAWRTFYRSYPGAKTYGEKIILIDQLIHSYHLQEKGTPAKSVASKLLEGNKKEVVAFLDRLSGIEGGMKRDWRRVMADLQDSEMLGSKE